MASRLSPADWKFTQNSQKEYAVFAPLPLLKVTAQYEGETAVAYCSNVPWVDVIEPSGAVISAEDGASRTKLLAAVPRTNVQDLHLFLDGVDLLAPGVVEPALPFP